MGIMPLTTMVLAHFFVRGERLNRIKATGFLLGFVGLVLLVGPQALLGLRGEGTLFGYQLAILGGAVCFAHQRDRGAPPAARRPAGRGRRRHGRGQPDHAAGRRPGGARTAGERARRHRSPP